MSSELSLWYRSVIPSSWEGESGGSQVQDLPGQLNDCFKMKRDLGYIAQLRNAVESPVQYLKGEKKISP